MQMLSMNRRFGAYSGPSSALKTRPRRVSLEPADKAVVVGGAERALEPIEVSGEGQMARSVTYVDDLVGPVTPPDRHCPVHRWGGERRHSVTCPSSISGHHPLGENRPPLIQNRRTRRSSVMTAEMTIMPERDYSIFNTYNAPDLSERLTDDKHGVRTRIRHGRQCRPFSPATRAVVA